MESLQVTDVNLDTGEMIVHFESGRRKGVQKFPYEQISKAVIAEDEVRKWFRKKKIRTLEIHVKDRKSPLRIREDRIEASFQATVQYLQKNAERYGIQVEEKVPAGSTK